MAKHLPCIPQTLRGVIQQIVLQHGTYTRSRAFRTQRELVAVKAVLKAIHLFFDDVGDFTDGALE